MSTASPSRLPFAARVAVLAAVLLTQASAAPRTQAGCVGEWAPTFGGLPGVHSTLHATTSIQAQVVFDDGSGPAIYVAGDFELAGGVAASHVARWDGTSWSALGTGTNGSVLTLAVFDDGTGPALFAGGTFTSAGGVAASRIAKWNGASWSALGTGCDEAVQAQVVFDDGAGPALYVSGHFSSAGGVAATGIARWNGASWSAFGDLGPASDLAVFDDGTGPSLFAVGEVLAKWSGTMWTLVGTLQPFGAWTEDLHVFDDGTGPALYVAGAFSGVDALPASGLARWDGTSWSVPGSPPSGPSHAYDALTTFDDGTGTALYAAWTQPVVGGSTQASISRWNGSSWSLVVASDPAIPAAYRALAGFDDGSGPALVVGGTFTEITGVNAWNVARRSGASWRPLGDGLGARVEALQSFDDGSGPALYVGGWFANVGANAAPANGIARWDGASWTPLGASWPAGTYVQALTVFDDGTGPALHAARNPAGGVLRWNGTTWTQLGAFVACTVRDFEVFDDGSGPALHAAGSFRLPGGAQHHVVRWNGTSWVGLGPLFSGPPSASAYALATFDGGTGPALHVGGYFTHSGATVVNCVARWNGASWLPLGSGVQHVSGAYVLALTTFDSGAGPLLYAGGLFTSAGGNTAHHIASWNGAAWSHVGNGTNGVVRELDVLDDGGGPALIACGGFWAAGGFVTGTLAKWNGLHWAPFVDGPQDVSSVVAYDDGSGPRVVLGGSFLTSGGGDSFLARWDPPCAWGSPYCLGDGSSTPCPCANHSAPGAEEGCRHSLGTGGKLVASGVARITADTFVLSGTHMPNGSALYFQGTFVPGSGGGAVFGDGLRCASGVVTRLGTQQNVGGASQFPEAGDASISVAGQITAPTTRFYQAWYRNAAAFCTPSTFNLTNGWQTFWSL